jgi:hypothetical protein
MKTLTPPTLSPVSDAIKCRHCGSTQVRTSSKSSGSAARVTYRCQSCKRHFHVDSGRPSRQSVIAGVALFVLALIVLGMSLIMGRTAEVDYQPKVDLLNRTALAKIQQDAKQGNPQAQYDLGRTYWQNAEYQQAFPLLKAATDHHHIEAEYLLGMAYLHGRGTVQNFRLALEQFTLAARQAHLEAQYQLGIFYRDGLGTPANKESSYLWLNIAAARGHEDALIYRDKLAAAMNKEELSRAQEASAQAIANFSAPVPANHK